MDYNYEDYDVVPAEYLQQPADIDDDNEDYYAEQMSALEESIFYHCLQPTIVQISKYMLMLLCCSLLCRFLWSLVQRFAAGRASLQHLIAIACGFLTLYLSIGLDFLNVLLLSLLGYAFILLLQYYAHQRIGSAVTLFIICMHFLYAWSWPQPETWQRILGIQMLAAMKIISLAFDIEQLTQRHKTDAMLGMVPFLGYIFCPSTCLLGPWISFKQYMKSLEVRASVWRCVRLTLANACMAMLFVCLSNCLVPMLCSHKSWIWLRTFRDALSVRCSHYFICFLSQANWAIFNTAATDTAADNRFFGEMVTKPWHIEFPHSISTVLRNWNIPMHNWLKTYIFVNAKQRFGNYFAALLVTFLVSAFLHGLHLEIYSILISLCIFAHVERVLRAKLANIFDCCITANGCKQKNCKFWNCSNSYRCKKRSAWAVRLMNLGFTAMSIMHLCYLGVLMNNPHVGELKSISTGELWQKWVHLDYASHWIVLMSYIFYRFI